MGSAPAKAEGPEAARALVQSGARPIDCFLRLPAESALLFELSPSIGPEGVALSAATDSGERALQPVRGGGPTWRADLAALDGEVVRLRLANPTGGTLRWGAPRVVGRKQLADPPVTPPEREGEPPNLLLYVVGGLRADRLSLYGHARPTSPRLEELARRSTVFESAYSTGPAPTSAIASLFASLPPSQVRGQLASAREGIAHTLAESFRRGGYQTAAFQANPALLGSLGFARGFDLYRMVRGRGAEGAGGARAEALHAEVFQWLSTAATPPFFLYVQSLDLHPPRDPPPRFAGRFGASADSAPGARYDDSVAYADHELGGLIRALDDLGLGDSTAIMVTADHGESLGEAGGRGDSLREERVRIPLIVSVPWQTAPARVEEVVGLLDVGPTALDLAGIGSPRQFQGRSLLRPRARHLPDLAVGEIEDREWYVREGDWKLVAGRSGARLIELASDPTEASDASGRHPIRAAYLKRLLWERLASYRDPKRRTPPLDHGLDAGEREELARALRQLGHAE